jgi:CRISPR-associated endonuclease/helicase Cas3
MPDIPTCYAHSLPGQPKANWQRLDEHLANVAGCACQFAGAFASGDWAWNAGWIHDLGKAAREFQAYLLRENGLDDVDYDGVGTGSVNHSSAGTALAERQMAGLAGRTLAYLIAGHHAGLTDYHPTHAGRGALVIRAEEGKADLDRIPDFASRIVAHLRSVTKAPSFVGEKSYHLWVRMLYSCLVDADFLDTEAFVRPEASPARAGFAQLGNLKKLFDDYMKTMATNAPRTDVNTLRQEVLAASYAAGAGKPGLFSMTVPTGGGKTLSSMAFAFEHAVTHGKRRIIYVIPYTSIIEQTAKILSDIFGPDNVVEHHSNLDPERETPRSRLASENWDAPIIVTTNVQFFESLFAAKSSRCRKLHNIANSVVILDEAQLLPPRWLSPCVEVINHLTAASAYGVTMVLSTATQPALPGLTAPTEIAPDPRRLYGVLKRTEFVIPQDLRAPTPWETLAEQVGAHEQVLCIVNTRRDCFDLWKLMPPGTIHLSALMCGAHRSKIIAHIKRRLRAGEPTRVISTQLVEAGVDIDFPVVYRALAGLDSIAQAAGRCNREGTLGRMGQVHVFVPPKDPPRGLMRKGADTTRELLCPSFDPQAPESFLAYFSLFYAKANDIGADWLNRNLVQSVPDIAFRTAAQEFQFIDDQEQEAVVVRYDGSEKWIASLRAVGPTRDIMRHLQRYTVNLPRRMANAFLDDGRLERLDSGIVVQCSPRFYDKEVGLNVYHEHLPVEDLIV